MKKSNKVLFIAFIPVVLILVFILYVLMPADKEFKLSKEMLENKQTQIENAKIKLVKAEKEKKLAEEIINMETQLGLFETNVPKRKDLDILLVDLEGFAKKSKVTILSLNAHPEKQIKLIDPKKEEENAKSKKGIHSKSSKRSSKRRKNTEEEPQPIVLNEIPLKIKVLGHYPEIIKFIKKLENYRRIISINGVMAKDFSKDQKTKTPRVEIEISTKIYTHLEKKLSNNTNKPQ